MPNVHKMVKHTFIILQQILQNLSHVFDHFVDTMDYRVIGLISLSIFLTILCKAWI